MDPVPLWMNEPSGFAVPAKVKVPLFFTVIEDPVVVCIEAVFCTSIFVPVN